MVERILGVLLIDSTNPLALVAAAVGAIVVSIVGAAGVLLRMALERFLTQVDERIRSLEKQLAEARKRNDELNACIDEQEQRVDWIKTILALHNLIPQPNDPGV